MNYKLNCDKHAQQHSLIGSHPPTQLKPHSTLHIVVDLPRVYSNMSSTALFSK